MAEEDPLDEIFVDENEPADKKILAEILKPFITIDNKGTLAFTENYDELQESKKAMVCMLCKKAMCLRGLSGISEKTNVKEIMEMAGISESSAKNALFTYYKTMVRDGMIPNYNLRKVREILLENG